MVFPAEALQDMIPCTTEKATTGEVNTGEVGNTRLLKRSSKNQALEVVKMARPAVR